MNVRSWIKPVLELIIQCDYDDIKKHMLWNLSRNNKSIKIIPGYLIDEQIYYIRNLYSFSFSKKKKKKKKINKIKILLEISESLL